jgi:hypothetical protein
MEKTIICAEIGLNYAYGPTHVAFMYNVKKLIDSADITAVANMIDSFADSNLPD